MKCDDGGDGCAGDAEDNDCASLDAFACDDESDDR